MEKLNSEAETETISAQTTTSADAETAELINFFFQGFRPPPSFTISEWADNHRVLPDASSGEPGQWRTSRTPYLREIMDELSPSSHAQDVVFMKGSQIGATETGINTVLYYIAHAPCPILLIEPTITVAERVSKQRIQPSINKCEQVRAKVGDPKSRSGGNTTLEKDFPGGTLIIGGANSAASMRSMPIRVVIFDEEDGYPDDVDGEGDPVDLGERRTTNFSRRKRFHISTPTIADGSRIEKRFLASDQRYYHVPCPFCNEKQIILWENIKYDNKNPATARLQCSFCKKEIKEHHKTWMLERGEWIKQNPASKIPGFHLSAFYSPLGWYSWAMAVDDHLKAVGNTRKRKVWVNTVLGEVWDESATTIDAHWIMKRMEDYPSEVPEGVLCLVAGADTQDNRLECSTIGLGWNAGLEIWMIDHAVFYGDPKQATVWSLFDQYLLRRWQHENGSGMHVAATCIDAMGHCTDEVYAFCKPREFRRVFPTQGRGGSGRPLVGKANRHKRAGVLLFQIGVDQAKESLYSRLKVTDPGPNYIHFPTKLPPTTGDADRKLSEGYFQQLTAEKRIQKLSAGMPKWHWVLPSGKRNEALDCFVAAMAAYGILNPNLELLAQENVVFKSDFFKPAVKRGRRIISQGVRV